MKRGFLALACVAVVVALSCTYGLKEPYYAEVTEIGFCRDWDDAEQKPRDISETFSADTRRIYLFAYAKTKEKLYFTVDWYHSGRYFLQQTVAQNGEGYIRTWIDAPAAGFAEGSYRITLFLGKTEFGEATFWVEKSITK